MPADDEFHPVTTTDTLLVAVIGELRTLNSKLGSAQRGAGELREPAQPKRATAKKAAAKKPAAKLTSKK